MKIPMALLAITALTVSACTSTNTPDSAKAAPAPQAHAEVKASPSTVNENDLAMQKLAAQQKEAAELEKSSIYFEFDKSIVTKKFHEALKKQADFMKANKNDSVTLEGNCDERGSAEYNLALGQRRAEAVRHQLQLLGVSKDRINTVSRGEEKPRLTCHEEKCWQENRRVDFIHQLN